MKMYRVKLITAKIRTLKSLLPSDNAVLQTIVKPALILPIDVTFGAKPADLTTESSRELGGIESINQADSTLTGKQFLVIGIDVVPKYGDEAHTGNHNPFLRICLAFGSGNGG